jgi:hypothetical protein
VVLTFQTRYPPNNNIIILQVIVIRFGFWLIRTKLEQEINLEQEKHSRKSKDFVKVLNHRNDSLGIYNQK